MEETWAPRGIGKPPHQALDAVPRFLFNVKNKAFNIYLCLFSGFCYSQSNAMPRWYTTVLKIMKHLQLQNELEFCKRNSKNKALVPDSK